MNWIRRLFAGEATAEKPLEPPVQSAIQLVEHLAPTGEYKFKRPSGWVRVQPSMNLGCPVIIYAASPKPSFTAYQAGQVVPIFSPAVTMIEYPRGVTAGQSLSQVFSLFQGVFPSMYAGFNVRSHNTKTLASGQEVVELEFVFTTGGTPMTAHAAMLLTDEKVLWLDGSCRSVEFPKHADMIRAVANSIETSRA